MELTVIKGSLLRAVKHAVRACSASAPGGDYTDGCQDLWEIFRGLPRNGVLVPVTRAEARALLAVLALCDRDDLIAKRQARLCSILRGKLEEVAGK